MSKKEIAYQIIAVDEAKKTIDVEFIDGIGGWARIEIARMNAPTLEALDEAVKEFAPDEETVAKAGAVMDLSVFKQAMRKGRITARRKKRDGVPVEGAPGTPLGEENDFIRELVRAEIKAEREARNAGKP